MSAPLDPLALLDRDETTRLVQSVLDAGEPQQPTHRLIDAGGWLTCVVLALWAVITTSGYGYHLLATLLALAAGAMTVAVVGNVRAAYWVHRERDVETIVANYHDRAHDAEETQE